MNIICDHCQTKLNIPDEKLPKDKNTTVNCPKCKGKLTIPAQSGSPIGLDDDTGPSFLSFEDRMNALACIGDAPVQRQVWYTLKSMGFDVSSEDSTVSALDKLEYHIFHLLVIDETFDQKRGLPQLLKKLNMMDMSIRRRMALVLVSGRFKTNDYMAALHTSVNNILNTDDITHVEPFLKKVISDHRALYMVYNESLKQAGKV